MKRRAIAVVLAFLSTFALTGTASASAPPVFTGYFQCFNGHVFSDFTDPDGDDTRIVAVLAVWRPSNGWTYHPHTNTGNGAHGVFFWTKLADHGIDPAQVGWYAVAATDQSGFSTPWIYADSKCKLL